MPEILSVFISSTYEDLKAYRSVALHVILGLGMKPVGMEHFGASTNLTVKECKEKIRECDLYILLVGWRPGWVPKPEDDEDQGEDKLADGVKSITEIEFEYARKLNKQILIFIG